VSSAVRRLMAATTTLCGRVDDLAFGPPVACVYNPMRYARAVWDTYLARFASGRKRIVFVGMNPGPWGMAQTGIPFGEVAAVRDWLGLHGRVDRPAVEHPKRPVEGFACGRSEVSGRRLWGLMAGRFGTPERFFAEHFVANYCPLVFMTATGSNLTPDKLPAAERDPLFAACDDFLRAIVDELLPGHVVGVGKFAAERSRVALAGADRCPGVAAILHPSPASPAANRDWAGQASAQLTGLGLW
jgi:single-strand selective monofunctional uracil DNA glycosylase